jgi:hypothetical protein
MKVFNKRKYAEEVHKAEAALKEIKKKKNSKGQLGFSSIEWMHALAKVNSLYMLRRISRDRSLEHGMMFLYRHDKTSSWVGNYLCISHGVHSPYHSSKTYVDPGCSKPLRYNNLEFKPDWLNPEWVESFYMEVPGFWQYPDLASKT